MTWLSRWYLLLVLVACLTASHAAVGHLALVPRMVLHPWLLTQGFVSYRDILDQHEVGLPIILSLLLRIVNDPAALIKWTFIGLLVATMCLVYLAGRCTFDENTGRAAALFFTVWVPLIHEGRLWYENVMAPLYVGAYALWPGELRTSPMRVMGAGTVVGLAVTVKQHAWAVVALYTVWAVGATMLRHGSAGPGLRLAGLFWLGLAVPVTAYASYIVTSCGLREYVTWAWVNNLRFLALAGKAPTVTGLVMLAALSAPVGALLLGTIRTVRYGRTSVPTDAFLIAMALAASVTAYPRFERLHLVAALPLLSVIFARSITIFLDAPYTPERIRWRLSKPAYDLICLVLLVGALGYASQRLARAGPQRLIAYDELMPIAKRLAAVTSRDERVLVFPDDEGTSNIYVLSQRLPPGFWTYVYPWYMTDEVVGKIMNSLEADRVRVVVYFPDRRLDNEQFAELLAYIQQHYEQTESLPREGGTAYVMTRR
jgi:hypothetical protein